MPFNVKKCIKLHNAIVEYACDRLPPEHQPITQKNWFTVHGISSRLPNLAVELDRDVKAFLRGVDVVHKEPHQHLAFCPLLIGLAQPDQVQPSAWESDGEKDDFVLLYTNPGHNSGGIVYSRSTQLVCYVGDALDDPSNHTWCDLDYALESYLRAMQAGKFVLDVENVPFELSDCDPLTTQGWRIEACTESELARCLTIWSDLVDAIAVRMSPSITHGSDNQQEDDEQEEAGLIPLSILDLYPAIPPFIRTFLSLAKRAPFTHIAPGLSVPSEAFIHRIGATLQHHFPSTKEQPLQTSTYPLFPFDLSSSSSPGLQITPDILFSHSSFLILPSKTTLYQHASCSPACIPQHGTPLTAILSDWWDRIEDGDWSVDENGVVGGEQWWEDAVMQDGAEGFAVEWDCVSGFEVEREVE